jgi:hypothetical protein
VRRLAALDAWCHPGTGRYHAPSPDTVLRVLAGLDAAQLAREVGGYLSGRARRAREAADRSDPQWSRPRPGRARLLIGLPGAVQPARRPAGRAG